VTSTWAIAQTTGAGTWGLLVMTVVAAGLLVLQVWTRRSGRPRSVRGQSNPSFGHAPALHEDMGRLLADLESLSTRIEKEVLSKKAQIDASIAQADKRIAALRILTEAARGAEAVSGSAARAASSDERRQTIYRLAEQGLSVEQIASKLGERHGEVELILNLRRASAIP
jgi:cytochrome c-type biogenesis protein CcmH/NrfF